MKKCTLSDVMFYSMDGHNSTYVILRLELDKPVIKNVMADAFAKACRRFPYFQTKLQALESGFALVPNENTPVLHEDAPDYVIDEAQNDGFLYRFSAYESTVTFSMFHGLSDASGALAFLKVVLAEYYEMLGQAVIPPKDIFDIDAAPDMQETAEPLDAIPPDVPPAPYTGSTFFHLPEKPQKEANAYLFSVSSDKLMQYVSSLEGSPNALAAVAMAKAIYAIHPEALKDGIDIGISINAKPMIGIPNSHWPFLQNSIFHFDEKTMRMDNELLYTCVRGKIFADCTEENLFPALAGVRSLGAAFEKITDDNMRRMICRKSTEEPRTTATVSYVGASDFGSIRKHIRGIYSFCDSCVPTLEVNYNDGTFYFTLSAHIDAKLYAEKLWEILNQMDFACGEIKCIHFQMK